MIEQGQVPPGVWLVKRGVVGLTAENEGGSEIGCCVRGAGCVVGLECLLNRPSPHRIWALTELRVCIALEERLRAWLGPLATPVGRLLELGIEEGARRARDRLDMGGSSTARVSRFLLRRCVDFGRRQLDVNQRVLARSLSMTPETVSRALSRLRVAGAITSTRPVVVGDVAVLRRLGSE